MKTITLLLITTTFLFKNTDAQFFENFDQSTSTLSGNCWVMSQINHTTTSGEVINGTGSAYTNPPTSSSGERTIGTPYLDVNTTSLSISFLYKTSSKISGNATRSITIGYTDKNGVFTSLQVLTMDKNSPTTVLSHTGNYTIALPGIYRIELRIGGSADGNSRVIFDDLSVNASTHYNATGQCNPAATAVDDVYTSTSITSVSGNVMTNDQIPADNEIYTASVVTAPSTGTLVLNSDGSFNYTPAVAFTGGPVTFTYVITDNGFPSTSSNIATVTINYPANQILPVKLIGFSATLKGEAVQVKWTVENAHEGNFYEVESSNDGLVFEVVGKVNAQLHSTEYSIVDNRFKNSAYYRLKMYNLDHSVSYSKIVIVNGTKQSENLNVIGNPVSSTLRFKFIGSKNVKNTARIYTISGIKVLEVNLTNASNEHTLNVQNLPSGTYAVNISSQGLSHTTKFIKK